MKRIMLILVPTILLLTVVLGGVVLADAPPGVGCKGLVNAYKVIEKENPAEADYAHSNIADTSKAHECKT